LTNALFDLPFEEPQEPDAREPQGLAPQVNEPRRVFSVSQLTERIREMLEERFF